MAQLTGDPVADWWPGRRLGRGTAVGLRGAAAGLSIGVSAAGRGRIAAFLPRRLSWKKKQEVVALLEHTVPL